MPNNDLASMTVKGCHVEIAKIVRDHGSAKRKSAKVARKQHPSAELIGRHLAMKC
jgi:hypothetical protein